MTADLRQPGNATSGMRLHSSGYGSKQLRLGDGADGHVRHRRHRPAPPRAAPSAATPSPPSTAALTVGDGLNLKLNTTTLDMDLTLDETSAQVRRSFAITGGGALFQLGPQVTSNQQVNVGIQSVAASKLGDNDVGFLNDLVTGGSSTLVGGNAGDGQPDHRAGDPAGRGPPRAAGRVREEHARHEHEHAQVALENVTASESSIRDADFAAETAPSRERRS